MALTILPITPTLRVDSSAISGCPMSTCSSSTCACCETTSLSLLSALLDAVSSMPAGTGFGFAGPIPSLLPPPVARFVEPMNNGGGATNAAGAVPTSAERG